MKRLNGWSHAGCSVCEYPQRFFLRDSPAAVSRTVRTRDAHCVLEMCHCASTWRRSALSVFYYDSEGGGVGSLLWGNIQGRKKNNPVRNSLALIVLWYRMETWSTPIIRNECAERDVRFMMVWVTGSGLSTNLIFFFFFFSLRHHDFWANHQK